MSGRWWRAYSGARHDAKLLRLSDKHFRWWFNLICVAADRDGYLPDHADLCAEFRTSAKAMTEILDALIAARLFDHDETGIRAHNWSERQYKSDVSNERVKRHRERKRNVECNVTETPSETEADTETDSVPNGTAAGAAVDPIKALFDAGVKLLTGADLTPAKAREMIGKWRKDHSDEAVMAAIGAASLAKISEPVGWITKYLANHAKPEARQPFETYEQARIRRGLELLRQ